MNASRSVGVVIAGRVQGVAYRAWTEREAAARGLSGHVRNRADGRVEAVFSGEPAAVEAMVQACWAGPAGARVEGVSVEAAPEPEDAGFSIRHD